MQNSDLVIHKSTTKTEIIFFLDGHLFTFPLGLNTMDLFSSYSRLMAESNTGKIKNISVNIHERNS